MFCVKPEKWYNLFRNRLSTRSVAFFPGFLSLIKLDVRWTCINTTSGVWVVLTYAKRSPRVCVLLASLERFQNTRRLIGILLFKNETSITIQLIHMLISGRVL